MSRVADPKAKIALLRASEEVFAERGVAGAKVEEIAKRAGVSKGAFYLHFESKEAALEQVVEAFLARVGVFFGPPSAYPEMPEHLGDLLDFFYERDLAIYEFLWQNRAILRILPSCIGEQDYLLQTFHAEIRETCRRWVDHSRREEHFREDVDPDLAATLIGGAYEALCQRMLAEEKRPPLEDWIEFALATFSRAFGTPALVQALETRNKGAASDIQPAPHAQHAHQAHRTSRSRRERGRAE